MNSKSKNASGRAMMVIDVSIGTKIMLDSEGKIPAVLFIDREDQGKITRGAVILQHAEAERLRDILTAYLTGQAPSSYERFESNWIPTLTKARAWMKANKQIHALVYAAIHQVAKNLPTAHADLFVVGDDRKFPNEDPNGVH